MTDYVEFRHTFQNKLLALTVCNTLQRMTGDTCTLGYINGKGWIVRRDTGTAMVEG